MKKMIIYVVITLLLGLLILAVANGKNSKVVRSSVSRNYDSSIPENIVLFNDYIFIAKVNKVLRTEYRNPVDVGLGMVYRDPYTVYDINVVENLKGNLITEKSIEFVQYGGINEDGKTYTLFEDEDLLEVGNYYLLFVGVIPETLEIETSDNNCMINLGNDVSRIDTSLIEKYKDIISQLPKEKETKQSKYDLNYIH